MSEDTKTVTMFAEEPPKDFNIVRFARDDDKASEGVDIPIIFDGVRVGTLTVTRIDRYLDTHKDKVRRTAGATRLTVRGQARRVALVEAGDIASGEVDGEGVEALIAGQVEESMVGATHPALTQQRDRCFRLFDPLAEGSSQFWQIAVQELIRG